MSDDPRYEERTELIRRKFGSGTPLTADEVSRLAEIDAQLDAEEMERQRPALEKLERIVVAHEKLAALVQAAVALAKSPVLVVAAVGLMR